MLERREDDPYVGFDELNRVNKIRRDFVANVSHELKTPATSLRLLAESLEETIDKDPIQARLFAAQLKKETERLSHLITDLLDLARLESQERVENPVPVDVRGVLMTVLASPSSGSASAGPPSTPSAETRRSCPRCLPTWSTTP
jgi:two-component system sensor histidine kinase SenX3